MKKMSLEDVRLRALAEVAAAHISLRRRAVAPRARGAGPGRLPPVLRLKYLTGDWEPAASRTDAP